MWLKNGKTAFLVLALAQAFAARAETGVDATTIRIGQTVSVTGQVAGAVKELNDGSKSYLQCINEAGGVHGRKIELITLDDKFDPELAGKNAKDLAANQNVFTLFQSRGTPHTQAILPVLQEYKIPLVAPSTGAALLHKPVNRYVFNVRSKYQTEVIKAVSQFRLIGITRIALVHVDDTFGRDALEGFNEAMGQAKLEPAAIIKFDREKPDFAGILKAITAASPHTVILVSSAPTAIAVINGLREQGSGTQIMTLSNNASEAFVKNLGKNAPGVIVNQITPPANLLTTKLGQEFQACAKRSGALASYAAMEGFVAAKVLVEGLKRAGPSLTREGFIKAMESIKGYDAGGLSISYSADDHTGSEFVEPTIIGKDGRFLR